MRKEYSEIKKIANKIGCIDIYSWSKYNAYKTDTYGYFLKYILKTPEDRNDSIYASMGSASHDAIESFYKNEVNKAEMAEKFEEKLFEYTIAGLKYDRSDDDKNTSIGNKYEECLRHFFINHKKIDGEVKLEMFVPAKINNIMMQCYIDFIHTEIKDNKKYLYITDWKTSTVYKGEKYEKEKGQLILYGLAIHQKLKIPLNQIIVRWAFLKYVNVDCIQANGKSKTRTIERNDIGNSLSSSAKMWLKKSELELSEEEINNYLEKIVKENSIDYLPKDVKNKFEIRDCYVDVPLTEESIKELTDEIIRTVEEIKIKECDYNTTKDEKVWWQEVTDKESYFMNNLSGYSAKLHKPYKEYLESRDMFKTRENATITKSEEDDMGWLTGLLD